MSQSFCSKNSSTYLSIYFKYCTLIPFPLAYDAYDGSPYAPEVGETKVHFLDLSVPQYGLPVYDWVISLEVAEHIPRQFEKSFLDNVARHAYKGVILSWAVPDQGGYSHVNRRTQAYVKAAMLNRGFLVDLEATSKMQRAAQLPWLKENTVVYRRMDGAMMETLYLHA